MDIIEEIYNKRIQAAAEIYPKQPDLLLMPNKRILEFEIAFQNTVMVSFIISKTNNFGNNLLFRP